MMSMLILATITKKRENKVLIVFDDMIADIEYNKSFKKMIKELVERQIFLLFLLRSVILEPLKMRD